MNTPMPWQQVLLIYLVMGLITFFSRYFPFLFFGGKRRVPQAVIYLGQVLPPAIIAMLVVYSLRTINFAVYPHGLPQLIAIVVLVGLHLWRHNNLISIFGGTAVYMLLTQMVFVI